MKKKSRLSGVRVVTVSLCKSNCGLWVLEMRVMTNGPKRGRALSGMLSSS